MPRPTDLGAPPPSPRRPSGESRDDIRDGIAEDIVDRLLDSDERAFATVVDAWSPTMLRVARGYVSTDESAREVVQDTWLAVVRGLSSFERRSSLRTWAFRILVNTAKTRGVREARTIPWSSAFDDETGPTVPPSRFRGPDDRWHRGWTPDGAPARWPGSPESAVLSAEVRAVVEESLAALPIRQRTVVSLRDVQGLTADEVCEILEISPENQRVLLHRGRARVRAALEHYYREAS